MSDWQESGQQAWDRLASNDAYWAVLTDRTKNDRDLRSFFVSGQRDIVKIKEFMLRAGIDFPVGHALDYGCGVGRLSRALHESFDSVTGVDVSKSMLTKARELHPDDQYSIRFLNTVDFFKETKKFDFILSLITLQHIDKAHMIPIIKHLGNSLSDHGKLVFQLPSRPKGLEAIHHWVRRSPLNLLHRFYSFLKGFILRRGVKQIEESMDMDGLSRNTVAEVLHSVGLKIVHCEEDHSAGPHWESFIYIVSK